MNDNYTFGEMADMHLVFGECRSNAAAARRRYAEQYPNRRLPDRRTFIAVDRRLREHGTLKPKTSDYGRNRYVRNVDLEEDILNIVEDNPRISTRKVASQLQASHSVVWRTIREQLLYPFHVQIVQALQPADLNLRAAYGEWLLRQNRRDNNFFTKILFTDEAIFTRDGVMNHHNEHFWAEDNPNVIKEMRHQHKFSVNVWAGILCENLIGPFFLPNRLNGENYLNFLQQQLPDLLEDVNLNTRSHMWFMQDGAPPHFSRAVREWLSENFPRRWIGRGADAPVVWPPRSPDFNPLDYCFWGFMKDAVYSNSITSELLLRRRILEAANDFRNLPHIFESIRFSLMKRARKCVEVGGGHFEHVL